MSLFAQAQIKAVKPTDRVALRKTIETAVGKFADQVLQLGSGFTVAVGPARVQFDDSDAARLHASITYHHGQAAHASEQKAILDCLCTLLSDQAIGPLSYWIDSTGADTDGTRYSFSFRVRCPAA